jgi:hypothetical protein
MDLTSQLNPLTALDGINLRGLNPSMRRALEAVKANFNATQLMMQAQLAATSMTLTTLVQQIRTSGSRSNGLIQMSLDDDDVKPALQP